MTGARLIRAVARTRLTGAGVLTDEEVRLISAFTDPPADEDRDVVKRALALFPGSLEEDAEVDAILEGWAADRP